MINYVYDLESYPNLFTMTAKQGEQVWQFEISHRRNDIDIIIQFLTYLRNNDGRMVGFNSFNFDYPLLHFVINTRASAEQAHNKCVQLINSDDKFGYIIWDNDQYVPQLDLFKVHHFDNQAKRTGLKSLEFKMRSQTIQELPFPPGTWLTEPQMDIILQYNLRDVIETEKFLKHSEKEIAFREELTAEHGRSFMNFSDVKIGAEIFKMALNEKTPGCVKSGAGTYREQIIVADIILPYIQFNHPQLQDILQWFKRQIITDNDSIFEKLSRTVNNLQLFFGKGGLHASVKNRIIVPDDNYELLDVDVVSYYPSIAIKNMLSPAHLGDNFCHTYAELKEKRIQYPKKSTKNIALKYALNGTFGATGSIYSPFYDPQYMMSITINGQLLLCMLIDNIINISGLQIIQANTDRCFALADHQA